jgi:hypothetical protein
VFDVSLFELHAASAHAMQITAMKRFGGDPLSGALAQ